MPTLFHIKTKIINLYRFYGLDRIKTIWKLFSSFLVLDQKQINSLNNKVCMCPTRMCVYVTNAVNIYPIATGNIDNILASQVQRRREKTL